ncbi:hypothetical protein JW960_01120 [candidate division KSB1 bacterium]|nr:hypothetical protein [candidate division KSB1 bacterium]
MKRLIRKTLFRTVMLFGIYVLIANHSMTNIAFGQPNLRSSLFDDIEDGRLTLYTPIEAAFIISGATTHDSLRTAVQWFNGIIDDIHAKHLIDDFEKEASAEKLFQYLHVMWLKTYKREATTLLDIKHNKTYNCVAATILYNYLCDQLGLSTMAFETPTHVYTIFTNFGDQIMVENTSSLGFNIIKNLNNYSHHMAQYYPEQEIYRIGLDRLYAYENSKGRKIDNIELLGLICYNQAVFSADDKNFKQAYEYVLMAQQFNKDSRSNLQFESNLYYRWGKQLFDTKRYYDAFEVFADATYRDPYNPDFKKNCLAAFHRTLDVSWAKKDWQTVQILIEEITELDIMESRNIRNTEQHLIRWGEYFWNTKQKDKGGEVIVLLRLIESDHDAIKNMEKLFQSM